MVAFRTRNSIIKVPVPGLKCRPIWISPGALRCKILSTLNSTVLLLYVSENGECSFFSVYPTADAASGLSQFLDHGLRPLWQQWFHFGSFSFTCSLPSTGLTDRLPNSSSTSWIAASNIALSNSVLTDYSKTNLLSLTDTYVKLILWYIYLQRIGSQSISYSSPSRERVKAVLALIPN